MPNQFNSPEGDLENYFVTESWLIDQWVGDTLWVWGWNYAGVLGNNNSGTTTTNGRTTPVTTSAGGANWKQVSGGTGHTAAIKTDGTLWIWGSNNSGTLGINDAGSTLNRSTPVTTFAGGTDWKQVSCGTYFTAAIKTDGTLWTWGDNNTASLGINNTSMRCTPVTTFAGGTNWKQVAGGDDITVAIKTDGTLWTWGYNNQGQLGINSAGAFNPKRCTPVQTLTGGTNWKQVSCGYYHTTAIKTDGTLWTWGRNESGQLGVNDTNTRCTPVTTFTGGTNWKQVAGGRSSFISAIKTDGTLWNWGGNSYGQLGINNTSMRCTPVQTFAGGTNWKQVSSAAYTTVAVTSGTDPTYFIS